MALAVLQVEHSDKLPARQDGHRQKRLEAVLRELPEGAEARVAHRRRRDRYGLAILRYPAGDALAHGDAQVVNRLRVRVLRGAQHEFATL